MKYNYKSIETHLDGVWYRSRLEATWAAFFNLIGWEFEYEPFDLDGWTPDFEIYTKGTKRVLVEVKPVPLSGSLIGDSFKFFETYRKAIDFRKEYNVLLLGLAPFINNDYRCAGVLVGNGENEHPLTNGVAGMYEYAHIKAGNYIFDISPEIGFWMGWIGNCQGHLTKEFIDVGRWSRCKWDDLDYFWGEAKAKTRYNP